MFTHLDCIALGTTRYNDRHSILSAITRQKGRMSLLIPAGNGREASRRRALLMPGGQFSCEVDLRDIPGRIPPMRDLSGRGAPAPMAEPVRSVVTLFIVDFLNATLRDAQPDSLLFDFLDSMFERLKSASGRSLANFHLLFLVKLTHFLGIEPDRSTYQQGYIFDLTDAIFRPTPPLQGPFLDSDDSRGAAALLRISDRNLHLFNFNAQLRNRALNIILQYYSLHFASLRSMKSLDIIRSLFH